MNSYFFRVEHDLLRSEAFKTLGGSAIKVYLVIGLYSDFGTDWAYPSIRTIAKQSGLSRQTVMDAVEQLSKMGLLATSKSKGRSTAYRIIRQAPQRPSRAKTDPGKAPESLIPTSPLFLDVSSETVLKTLDVVPKTSPKAGPVEAQSLGQGGRSGRPELDTQLKEDTTSIPIPGTPFRITAGGRLLVAVDLQELLTNQGIPGELARRLVAQKDAEAVAKVLLNALYLESQGKLQNGPGYIRAGIEDGYDLLPQVATRLENRRRELEEQLRGLEARDQQSREANQQVAEREAIAYVLERLSPSEVDRLVNEAVGLLPEPLIRRNPTLSNPFVRAKVYELACGEPDSIT
jgi:Helix-turn-helix domain